MDYWNKKVEFDAHGNNFVSLPDECVQFLQSIEAVSTNCMGKYWHRAANKERLGAAKRGGEAGVEVQGHAQGGELVLWVDSLELAE